jgi:YkoY family integral membrane protein
MQHILLKVEWFGMDPAAAVLVVLNLVLIESLLSVDNAAVLATMVLDLPEEQRGKALKYGIIGAYVFRGICLLLVNYLTGIWWLKGLGGFYLLYLAVKYFSSKATPEKEDDSLNKKENWFYRQTVGRIGVFWSTVILVELMDIAFSIDNVFAAVALARNNLTLLIIGVFIGILAMRFVAQTFVRLMSKFPFLETAAFIVIAILGIKLSLTFWTHFSPAHPLTHWLDAERTDMYISLVTVCIFLLPLFTSWIFNWPHRSNSKSST